MPASRSALSMESEAWIRLRPISRPKSPRIVPGAASRGFVLPTVLRTDSTALVPSKTAAMIGDEVM